MKLALPTLTLGILLAIAAGADRGTEDAASLATAQVDYVEACA